MPPPRNRRRAASPRRRGEQRGATRPAPPPEAGITPAAAPGPARVGGTPPRRRPPWRWPRWRIFTALPAWTLALVGIAGLLATIRSSPPVPPARDPIRFPSGTPLAERLVVVLAPQLDERGLLSLRAALGIPADAPGSLLTVERPEFASFDEVTLQLFSGNVAGGAAPPVAIEAPGQPPDTLVRGVSWQGRGVALVGPPDWRALFGVAAAASGSPAAPPATSAARLAEAGNALRARGAALVLVELGDLAARDLREEAGGLRPELAALGAALEARDAVLIIGAGGIGEGLRLAFSGAGVKSAPLRALALNDVAPTCAVLIGAPYPFEARGRIAWPLLDAGERRKAEATVGLARQRAGLAVGTVPLGMNHPPALITTLTQLPEVDAAIGRGEYAYGYQLGSSVVNQADRFLATPIDTAPLPIPRRAEPGLAIAGVAIALYALLLLIIGRSWGTLGAALIGAALALAIWIGIAVYMQRIVVPRLAVVVALTALYALVGGGVSAWLAGVLVGLRRLPGPVPRPGWRAVEALALFAALPAAVCAYRYGFPWGLRLEETAPLFRWRSALLAPVGLLLAGYAWLLLQSWWQGRARRAPADSLARP